MTPDRSADRSPLRIVVVDDHPAVREGLALLVLSEGMEVSAAVGRPSEALASIARDRPDVVVVDLSLDGEDGLPLVTDLKGRRVPVLVYSMHNDGSHVQSAFAAGALGYVTKSEFRGVLVEAIREVAAGRHFISAKAAAALTEHLSEARTGELFATLSGQERQVYRLIGQGEGTCEIAKAMNISTHTVESYYARIQLKLGLEGMHQLRRHAIDHFRQQPC